MVPAVKPARFLGACHRTGRRTRPGVGPGLRGLRASTASRSTRSSPNDVMRGAFREFSGGIYDHPRVRVAVDDGRSFVRRSPDKYDVIQASLVDTWAATAAGAYTLTENTLYTVEAFTDYLDHLTRRRRADDHALGVRRAPAGLAGAGSLRAARLGRRPAARDRPARSRRDVPAEEIAVHRRRGRAACRRSPSGCSSGSCMRRAAKARSRRLPANGSRERKPRRYAKLISRARSRAVLRQPTSRTSGRRPTIGRSSSTRRSSRISSTSRSGGRCCSATA